MATNVVVQNGVRIVMDASKASTTDVCPICKSTLQTSPNLRFKVSSRCYHRICEGCVDRKFSAGKAQCPVSGCDKMLWKRDWKIQTFEDIQVVREVDLRKRVFGTLDLSKLGLEEGPNGWEDCFEDLRSYNDYLETKEELAMNLIYNTDVAATNKKLRDFQTANGLGKEEDGKQQTRLGPKPSDYPDRSGLIKGLKTKFIPKPATPYNAFTGVARDRGYYDAADAGKYETAHDRNHKHYELHDIGGYSWEAYVDESLLRAFSGLGVFIGNEKGGKVDMTMPLATQVPHAKAVDDVF